MQTADLEMEVRKAHAKVSLNGMASIAKICSKLKEGKKMRLAVYLVLQRLEKRGEAGYIRSRPDRWDQMLWYFKADKKESEVTE